MISIRSRIITALAGLVVLVVFLACCMNLNAQVATATLSGTVSDASGAGIPGAQVTLAGMLEKTSRQMVTDAQGRYMFPSILPGSYQLVVAAKAFQTQTLTNIVLTVGQGSTLDVVLSVAKAVEVVNVKEAPPLLQTTTATLGADVTATEFTTLPMSGRNFKELLGILPGVTVISAPNGHMLSPEGQGTNPSIYGQRQRDNNYEIDGVPNNEVVYNGVPTNPPPEAVSEMKVLSGPDLGAYGWSAGGVISLVTKSGTNKYHGDAWEFVQNNDLNARSFFLPSVGAYQWNMFGGAFGGPVTKRSGWYVFGWYEGTRVHSAAMYTALVPTPAELSGDFSADPPIYNPYTSLVNPDGSLASRQLFAGNQIPTNLLNSSALTMAQMLYPAPNFPANIIPGVNFLNMSPGVDDASQYSVRLDHQFRGKDNFYARYSQSNENSISPGLPALPSIEHIRNNNIAVSLTHTFSPTFLITGRFGWQHAGDWYPFVGPDAAKEAGTLAAFPPWEGKYDTIPPTEIAGYPMLSQEPDFDWPEMLWSGTVDAQKVKGRHTLAFGGRFTRDTLFTDCQTGTFEEFTVDQTGFGSGTGDALASFLLGLPESAGREAGHTAGDMSGNGMGFYVQDNFRATPKLTLNFGLRWDFTAPLKNSFGDSTFEWETGNYYWDLTNPVTGAPANIRRGMVAPDYRGYQPRIGIAYRITPKTVVRTSYGIFSEAYGVKQQGDQGNHGNWPFAFAQTIGSLNLTLPTAFLANPFPGPPCCVTAAEGLTEGVNSYYSTSRVGYVHEWNFSLQRQLTPSLMLEAAYFGSHGVKLPGQIIDNTGEYPGTTPLATRTKWPDFPPYIENNYNEFSSEYNGMSLKLERHMSRNLMFLIAFTWQKTLDDSDSTRSSPDATNNPVGTNPTRFNFTSFWGPATFSVPKVFNASYVYNVPWKTSSKWANALAGNWSFAGGVGADDGTPYVVYIDADNENNGCTVVGRDCEFPSLVANPNAGIKPTAMEWFNTAAYVLPPFGTAGNAGKHSLYSDPEIDWDTAVLKRFPFGENRWVEFRAEFFNILNLSTFAPPGDLMTDPNFGEVSSTRQGGRMIQFALKLHF